MRRPLACWVLVSAALPGCALQQPYDQSLARISLPSDDGDRQRKCEWIHSEIVRMRSIAPPTSSRTGMYADAGQIQSRHNIAALEARAADFGCPAGSGNHF